MKPVPETVRRTFTLWRSVDDALQVAAKMQGLEVYEVLANIVADYVIQQETLDDQTRIQIQAGRRAVAYAVEIARMLCRSGRFSEDITLHTFRECAKSVEWCRDYALHIGDDQIKASGNPMKGPINREIGFRIREAIGAEVLKDPNGKPVIRKVLNEVIQSYTCMKSCDLAS